MTEIEKLTDRELAERTLAGPMGWHKHIINEEKGWWMWRSPEEKQYSTDFNPVRDIRDWRLMRDTVLSSGYQLCMKVVDGVNTARALGPCSQDAQLHESVTRNATWGRVTCEALVAAWEAKP
jgi:hypothetical protein